MPNTFRSVRSLKNIRTRCGAVDAGGVPYKMYMKLTSLEMECYRRQIEQKTVQARLKEIRERLRLLEAEKGELLRRLQLGSARASTVRRAGHGAGGRAAAGPFQMRY